jgi:serine/threonine-protein kinase
VDGVLIADRYRLVGMLGRGGMGEVWHATDAVLDRPVAVKLMHQGSAEATDARFQQEAKTAARLNHPNVVGVYDFGADQDRLYLVMELLSGRSLAVELAERGRLSVQRVTAVGAQVAAGLAAAHRMGVVHRDIKPANLLVAADGTMKIGDFGIARFTGRETQSLTATGQAVGTGSYMAPEQAQGRLAGPAADMYALGCVLYELLVGCPPFLADTATAVLHQHVEAVPTSAHRHRPDLPASLDALILALLDKDPDQRPTAQQAVDMLTVDTAPTRTASPRPQVAPDSADPGRPATARDGDTRRLDAATPASQVPAARQPGSPAGLRTRRSRRAAALTATSAAAIATVTLSAALATGQQDSDAQRPDPAGISPAQATVSALSGCEYRRTLSPGPPRNREESPAEEEGFQNRPPALRLARPGVGG